ncbi:MULTISPECIES: LLM class flavin-dependent oxidoreductase [unclassified Rhizobium]|uniref:LLM class flavin-dependent oxidoreductase n=1 Tax=unclassified Rhizobium TaxID=2613769 RepID=UPI000BD1F480|nr:MULTISPECIES: LLM class flavin-dependent oxidoreductase [unclassified Rhizobium]MDH7809588.1 alkanesulfonate monooxygenase SsuD/methylene tetrahydromethanopterin reductase-like flavin-dependent oxidoreductase (luciferase family) [Rhizobium sp. AN67]SOD50570.1 Flavin-dependent oxidoreductase, luciferase family (includes alkanesulfonate monooxygenase SsuD and methylene tetrahydromethanopterin reductase) [Rhizobium sp. AN6A]
MKAYYFSECPYPDAWSDADKGAIRVTYPNRLFDPKVGADLINYRLDEWCLADELGMNIMINEHRSSTTCITASCIPPAAMLARQTKNARILLLGPTVGMRRDPVGLAEEVAYIDCVSRGRIDLGLLKGYSAEIAPSNMNPATTEARYWEAHDLVIKALSHRDGPFNWEGEHFQYRQVNIWPRPYQEPCPPIWISCFSVRSAAEVANRGHNVVAALDSKMAANIFGAYRKRVIELGQPAPSFTKFGYMALVAVANTRDEALQRLAKVRGWVWSSGVSPPQFTNPPGYIPVAGNVEMMKNFPEEISWTHRVVGRSGRTFNPSVDPVENLIDSGMGFAGTPDEVFAQLKELFYEVGGFGHLLAMMQGGDLGHHEAVDSMTLFSKEVLPRLVEFQKAAEKDGIIPVEIRAKAG